MTTAGNRKDSAEFLSGKGRQATALYSFDKGRHYCIVDHGYCIKSVHSDTVYIDSVTIPSQISDTLEALAGASYLSTIDLSSGYWQVGVDPKDQHKTAFVSHRGLFEFCVLPFGLCNAPATFERLMEFVLAGLIGNSCLVYLDDIVIFSRTFEEHLEHLTEVFSRLKQANLNLLSASFSEKKSLTWGIRCPRMGSRLIQTRQKLLESTHPLKKSIYWVCVLL